MYDDNTELDRAECAKKVLAKAEEIYLAGKNAAEDTAQEGTRPSRHTDPNSCRVLTGIDALYKELAEDCHYTVCVLSPGVPTDGEVAETIKKAGVPIIGEIELAFLFEKGKVLAITGTNGKTTTTTLLGEIMQRHQSDVLVVGNIGTPYTEEVVRSKASSVTVAEISSFQLETTDTFHPIVSAILNLTPDHLNRHHTMENYVHAKQDITKAQTKENACILNAEDPYTEDFANRCPAGVVLFSSGKEVEDGFYEENGEIYKVEKGSRQLLIRMKETHLLGKHNAENIMAAIAMADAAGVPMETILAAVKDFHAVEHRIEYVRETEGVQYFNDSKGTNPDAAIKAITAMERPTWLIGGGYDKDSTYDEWIESFGGKVRGLVLLGQTAEKIADCAKKHGFTDLYMVSSLEDAVALCHEKASEGEAVLLSPACASWGMFKNFEERGRIFKELVNAL
ncbi:MAG: UDP-N-acetylmuramoyl-L-alanine--D-glutamate ligase [Lachnospiraceae bacterium]|nr:UDP-N-acetylmuramoyl-L-alanine--D-glutamate ligase [Lachnospiraceae bacterium]